MIGIRQILLAMVLLASACVALADQDIKRGKFPNDTRPQIPVERSSYDPRGQQTEPVVHHEVIEHRPGRLSVDERRELRRQINEVGQDIYRPRR